MSQSESRDNKGKEMFRQHRLTNNSNTNVFRIILIIATVAVILVIILLTNASWVFHSSIVGGAEDSSNTRIVTSTGHRHSKLLSSRRAVAAKNSKNRNTKNATTNQPVGYHLGRDELRFKKLKDDIDRAMRGGATAHVAAVDSKAQHVQQHNGGNDGSGGDFDGDNPDVILPTRESSAPQRSNAVRTRWIKVRAPDQQEIERRLLQEHEQQRIFVHHVAQRSPARSLRVHDTSLILFGRGGVSTRSGLVPHHVRGCRGFFPDVVARNWKERLIHMWTRDPLLNLHNGGSDAGGAADEIDIDLLQAHRELLSREIDQRQDLLPKPTMAHDDIVDDENDDAAVVEAKREKRREKQLAEHNERERIVREKLKEIHLGPEEATGRDFVFATNNDGTSFGRKTASRENIAQRREVAVKEIQRQPESFAYTKWELRRDSPLHFAIRAFFDSRETRVAVCKILDSDCPPDFVSRAKLGDLFVSLFEGDDFLSAHNDLTLGSVTIAAHFLVDKQALAARVRAFRKEHGLHLNNSKKKKNKNKKQHQGKEEDSSGGSERGDDIDATAKKLNELAAEGDFPHDAVADRLHKMIEDADEAADDAALNANRELDDEIQEHVDGASHSSSSSSVLEPQRFGPTQFLCFDDNKPSWCVSVPARPNELLVFRTAPDNAPHRVTRMLEPERFLRFGITGWFAMPGEMQQVVY